MVSIEARARLGPAGTYGPVGPLFILELGHGLKD
jgi:hypothetical protein